MLPQRMSRHEAWRAAYRANRYLGGATRERVEERSKDIGRNTLWVSPDGKITVRSETNSDQRWWELWTHVLEEIQLRGHFYGDYDLMERPWVESLISAPGTPAGLKVLRGAKLPSVPYLARLGQRDHIRESYARGRFRIAPASSYADPSLASAIADDELAIQAVQRVTIQAPGGAAASSRLAGMSQPLAELTRTVRLHENYFVLCMSGLYDHRLMTDFGAEALLIIRKPDLFSRRLKAAVSKVKPDLIPWFGPVQYYDPYKSDLDAARIPMLKHFKYAYQNEMRFAWTTADASANWSPFFVEVGSLRDIASLYL